MAILEEGLLLVPLVETEVSVTGKIQAMIEAALVGEADAQASFTWAGQTDIPCVPAKLHVTKVLDISGYKIVKKCKLKFRLEMLSGSDRPKRNDNIALKLSPDGEETILKIAGIGNFNDVIMELELEDPSTSSV